MTDNRIIHHFVRAVAAMASLALGATYAAADGIPGVVMTDSPYVSDWSGFYIGAKLGGVVSDFNWEADANVFNTGGAVPGNTPVGFSPSGVAGGIIGGGNLQLGHWVFGAELSFSGTGLSQSTTSPFFPATDTFSTELDWLATVEGRIGYGFDRILVFGKGGWAGGHTTLSVTSPVRGSASTSLFVDGWTIGGGIEYACWSSVILGIEYDYTSLNLTSGGDCPLCDVGLAIDSTPASTTGDATMSAVMVRLSYLFMPED